MGFLLKVSCVILIKNLLITSDINKNVMKKTHTRTWILRIVFT